MTNPGNAETLQADKRYPIHYADWGRLPEAVRRLKRTEVGAVWTQEVRKPKAGEWYLSGAEIEAYCALSNLSTPHHMARLVRCECREVLIDL